MDKMSRKVILEKKKEIEKHIREKIRETEFYKRFRDKLLEWYNLSFEECLLVTGGYGIGKSTTVKQILEENKIEYTVLSDIYYKPNKIENLIRNIVGLKEEVVIIFDDCKLTKWVEYSLLHLLNKNYPILIILNSIEEIDNLFKVIGRLQRLDLFMSQDDIKLLREHLEKIYNISLEKYVLINLRDLVKATLKELYGIEGKLYIEELLENVKSRKSKEETFRNLLKKLKEKGIPLDVETIVEIGVKLLHYKPSTIRKNLPRYLPDI